MYNELRKYHKYGMFLLGTPEQPSKFIYFGLPPLYVHHQNDEFIFDVNPSQITEDQYNKLLDLLSNDDYNRMADMQAIICQYKSVITKFVKQRDLFDYLINTQPMSRKAYRVALFRREYDYEQFDKWIEIVNDELPQPPSAEKLSVEDTAEKVEQAVSEETASA